WAALIEALGPSVLHGVPPHDAEALAARLLATTEGARRPRALVLDQTHAADGPLLCSVVDHLLARPSPLRILFGTRADPALPLQRLRIAGQLAEIRGADLAFNAVEAGELLAGHGLTLSGDQVIALVARTEGWAAGLRLAALMLAEQDDPAAAVT